MVKLEDLRDTAVMTTHNDFIELAEIYEAAVDLAFHAFTNPSDDHVQGVFERLLFNAYRGDGASGAITIH